MTGITRKDIQMKVASSIKLGENYTENNQGIKWQEPDTHNITKLRT